jgi:peptidoglycan/LPS O-acetylase OafA/YrhL
MKTIIALALRIIGTFSGVVGVATISFSIAMYLRPGLSENSLFLPMAVFAAFIGAYQIYFCYLTWRRLSPKVIRHFFGLIGFFVWVSLLKYVDITPRDTLEWEPFIILGSLILFYYCYRTLSNRVSRALFPETENKN